MRRAATAVACVLLLALCIWCMELVELVEAPQPPETPAAAPAPEWEGPVEIVIGGLDGAALDNIYVAIPVDGMEEVTDYVD